MTRYYLEGIKEQIAYQTSIDMIGVMLSNVHHTFDLKYQIICGKNKDKFLVDLYELLNNQKENTLSDHFSKRLVELKDRLYNSTAILVVGMDQFGRPSDINCGLCGFETCHQYHDFQLLNRKKEKAICAVEYMSFSASLARGMLLATQKGVPNVLAQSVGRAALLTKTIIADFAMAIILEISDNQKTPAQNKMDINMNTA